MERVCSLKWKNHDLTFLQLLNNLRKQQMYTDVVLACSGKFYNAHRMILAACSDYFCQIFEHVDSNKPVVVLNDVKCTDLEALLDYMYLGEANVMPSEVPSIIHAAENMEIKGLSVDEDEMDKILKHTSKRSKRKWDASQYLSNDSCYSNKNKVLKGQKPKASKRLQSSISPERCPDILTEEDQTETVNVSHTCKDEETFPDDPLDLNETASTENNGYDLDYMEQASSSHKTENIFEEDSISAVTAYQNTECDYNAPSSNYSFDSYEQNLPPQISDPDISMELIQLKTSKLSRMYFILDDYIYLSSKVRGKMIYLICISKRSKGINYCRASATGVVVRAGNKVISVKNFALIKEHNHNPAKSHVADLRLRRSCIERANSEDLACHLIYKEEKQRFPDATITYFRLQRTMIKFRGKGSVRRNNTQSPPSNRQSRSCHSIFGEMNDSEEEEPIDMPGN